MGDEKGTPKFYLPIISGGIGIGLACGMIVTIVATNILGGFSFSSTSTIIGLVMVVVVAAGVPTWIIVLSVAGWILHTILIKNTNFEKIPMFFGIALLIITAILMIAGLVFSVVPIVDYFTMISYPSNAGKEWLFVFYIANAVLALVEVGSQVIGLIGSISLIKY